MPAELAAQLVDHLASLEIGAAGESAAARRLAQLDPVEAVHALHLIIGKASRSHRASHALVLLERALIFGAEADLPSAQRSLVYDAAVEFDRPDVAALFLSSDPVRSVDATVQPSDPVLGSLTLGHKKMLARQADSDRIARLAFEGDARVVRELLINPRLTEDQVVRIAARRPARAETLEEIYRSPRWSLRAPVRRALAQNPYTPPEVALKVLPHLLRTDLRVIARSTGLHESVRALAKKLAGDRRA